MIDPDFWEDQKLAKCPWPARYVFLGLISNSDDAGRLCGHTGILHSRIFHAQDGISLEEMESWLSALERENLIVRYTGNNEDHIWLPGFFKHQTIKHPSPSKRIPPPKEIVRTHIRLIEEYGTSVVQVPHEDSITKLTKLREIKEKGKIRPLGIKPFQLLMGYEAYIGYDFPRIKRKLPGKEMSAAKALIENGYTFDQICGTHDYLLAKDPDFWGSQPISLQSVLKHIDFYIKKKPKTTKQVIDGIEDL